MFVEHSAGQGDFSRSLGHSVGLHVPQLVCGSSMDLDVQSVLGALYWFVEPSFGLDGHHSIC